jgi:hypothetical protein
MATFQRVWTPGRACGTQGYSTGLAAVVVLVCAVSGRVGFALQIGKALECLHKHNIVHGDIKPENVFRDKDGNLKVGDLGQVRGFPSTPEYATVTQPTSP